jgi:hypothetical protein
MKKEILVKIPVPEPGTLLRLMSFPSRLLAAQQRSRNELLAAGQRIIRLPSIVIGGGGHSTDHLGAVTIDMALQPGMVAGCSLQA